MTDMQTDAEFNAAMTQLADMSQQVMDKLALRDSDLHASWLAKLNVYS